jgi:hypothetical protein
MFPHSLQQFAKFLLAAALLVILMAQVQAQTPAPAEAGKVLMAIGEVKVARGGQVIPLVKGASVQAGDGVITGIASNAQLRMSDGAVIALRAQSEFKINEYNFNGKTDGSEKAELSLVKGGVRAVTGAIGRENKDNLKINAVVATVGIRGTGFNINVCEGNCFNPDKSPVKDGLYAGVFEGKIVVKNEASVEAVGVNQYLFVADKDTAPKFILAPPNFLPDPLTGQKSAKAKGKGEAATEIPSLAVAVSAPSQPADAVVSMPSSALPNVMGVTITQPPALASGTSPFTPSNLYNKLPTGDGSAAPTGAATYILQKAEVFAGATGSDGLPIHSITPGIQANYSTTTNGTQVTQISSANGTNNIPGPGTTAPTVYAINGAQQMESGTWGGVVSWGRWANGSVLVGGYNNGQPINYAANSGFAYIVGVPTTNLNQGPVSYTFNLVGASTPVPVSNPQGTWAVTSGSLTANFANASINGNLGLYANQPAGYGTYNMTFNGAISSSSPLNSVTTYVSKVNGSLATCSAGCSGTGNVGFYGNPAPTAAGLSYSINTGSNVVQGVAVFKR